MCGVEVIDIGRLILVLVGEGVKGYVFNVLGDCLDELGYGEKFEYWLIYCKLLVFEELEFWIEMFEIGLKVVDLLILYVCGGKIVLFGGVGVGKMVLI